MVYCFKHKTHDQHFACHVAKPGRGRHAIRPYRFKSQSSKVNEAYIAKMFVTLFLLHVYPRLAKSSGDQ